MSADAEGMLQVPEHAARTATDLESPELALVDESLRVRARAQLPETNDTLLRLERDIAWRRLETRARYVQQKPTPVAIEGRTGWQPPRKLVAAGSVTVVLAAALLVGVNVDLRGTPAGAFEPDTTLQMPAPLALSTAAEEPEPRATPPRAEAPEPAPMAAPTPAKPRPAPAKPSSRASKARTAAPRKPRPVPLAPRRFAWAPVSGATGYRVEFFREDELVYSSVVGRPHLELAARWTFKGRRHTLAPGNYRWYVWPIRSGRRDSQATVQAELSVR